MLGGASTEPMWHETRSRCEAIRGRTQVGTEGTDSEDTSERTRPVALAASTPLVVPVDRPEARHRWESGNPKPRFREHMDGRATTTAPNSQRRKMLANAEMVEMSVKIEVRRWSVARKECPVSPAGRGVGQAAAREGR